MTTTALLQIQNLDIRFRIDRKSEPFQAVKGISFDIPTNTTVALVGESGSGKSVSAMAILGLLPENAIVPPESRVLYGGRDLLKASLAQLQDIRGKDISVIFQEPMTSLNPVFSVGEQISEVLRLHMGMGMRQALLAGRPRLDRRPTRLPVIDDFLKGDGRPHLDERRRGTSPADPIILEVKDLNNVFFLREGLFGKRAVPAVKDVSFPLPKGK